MKLKHILTVVTILLFINLSSGQQYIDPALFGSFGKVLNPSNNVLLEKGEGDAMMLYRYQWVGFEGAPKSLWFSGNIGVGNAGVIMGINAKQSRIGVERNSEMSASFTKRLQISESEYIGLGANLGYTHQQGNFNPLDPGDPAFQNVQYGTLLYGLSATLISPDRYYFGFSMPKAIFGAKDSQYVRQFGKDNTFYLSGGLIIALNEGFQLRPNLLVSYREVTGLLFDASAMFYVDTKIGLGAGYRQRGDLMGMAEFNLGKLRIGYSYQQNLKNKDLNRYITNSTHELGIAIRFGKDNFSIL
ncbi:PorP/SprF family type IX secretion system membrane protein [Sphingobacterium spiritivorum]|uniref:PorP/SprF family type IX secretion system membrane protein n=1 Tax=Sphingobacterium spiritivorum TaxID=258 RepID=UPI00191B3621|nr:PorP/SprF family type IX secretion system membrane protein [Sphingobacterium spiritivorum]QQT26458.1 PorP/SprF family type IX secretion system membrane protein [Sphingobacterium spiritivorum]